MSEISRLKVVSGWMLLLLAAVSFVAGVPALVAGGSWAGLGGLAVLVPAVVDGGIVFFSAATLAGKAEGSGTALPWAGVATLTGASVAVQTIHVLAGHTITIQSLAGAVIAALFPLTVLASTRSWELLRYGRAVDRIADRAAAKQAAKTLASPVARVPVRVATARPAKVAGPARVKPRTVAQREVAKIEARRLFAAGISQREIARRVGLSRPTIANTLQDTA